MQHEIHIVGPELVPDRLDAVLLRTALDALIEGVRRAVRLLGEGRSKATNIPAWVKEDGAFDYIPHPSGEERRHVFVIGSKPLVASDPTRFAQLDFFREGDHGEKSGIDLYEDGLEAILTGARESDLVDRGLLESFVDLGKVFSLGVERIEFINGRTVAVDAAAIMQLKGIVGATPRPQHVRVAGKLESLKHLRHRFLLELDDGSTVGGIAEGVPDDELRQLWGRKVVVEGTAHFHPSGKPQRIEATRVAPATAFDLQTFAQRPRPLAEEKAEQLQVAPARPAENWIDAVWGQWPGDETDEEITALIKEFS